MPEQVANYLRVLRILVFNLGISQRQPGGELGVSLGNTHNLLCALLQIGLLKAKYFCRSDNKLAYLYLVTPHGIAEKLRLACIYLASKERVLNLSAARL